MAKHWIENAVKHPGVFTKRAHAAGESTSAYARENANAPGTLGRQARLAQTLAKIRPKKSK